MYPDHHLSMFLAEFVQKEADRIFKTHAEWKPTKKGGFYRLHFGGRVLRETDSSEMMQKIEKELSENVATWCFLNRMCLKELKVMSEKEKKKCPNCGSEDLTLSARPYNSTNVVDGRLRMNEVFVRYILGCNSCSETVKVLTEDQVTLSLKENE